MNRDREPDVRVKWETFILACAEYIRSGAHHDRDDG